ncbi:MAG: SDR family NAD(P)-dependent oxidoreductase, partial [Planctomycetota bacterium]
MELTNRRALVTGAAVRVGREIALELARAGTDLVVHYRTSEDAAEATAEEIRALGVACDLVRADLADPVDLERVAAAGSGVDVLVNSASIFPRTPLGSVTLEQWDEVIAANLRAPFFLAQAIGVGMKSRGEGVIVNITDWCAERPYRGYLPYGASKAGLAALTTG